MTSQSFVFLLARPGLALDAEEALRSLLAALQVGDGA